MDNVKEDLTRVIESQPEHSFNEEFVCELAVHVLRAGGTRHD